MVWVFGDEGNDFGESEAERVPGEEGKSIVKPKPPRRASELATSAEEGGREEEERADEEKSVNEEREEELN